MSARLIGFLSLCCFFVAISTAHAASWVGKWVTAKGAEVECGDTECKITKGKEEGEGKAGGAVILKDLNGKDGKGTAKMHMPKRDKWGGVTVEAGDKELKLKIGKEDRSKEIVWKKAQ
mgnify:CR=1 FL=1